MGSWFPEQGSNPRPPAWVASSLNHWAIRASPHRSHHSPTCLLTTCFCFSRYRGVYLSGLAPHLPIEATVLLLQRRTVYCHKAFNPRERKASRQNYGAAHIQRTDARTWPSSSLRSRVLLPGSYTERTAADLNPAALFAPQTLCNGTGALGTPALSVLVSR